MPGDIEEAFFSYGVNQEKSKVYSVAKDRIPNAIISTWFKKHFLEIMNERRDNEESSTVFFYLPSITDSQEKINLYLNPIDCSLEFLNSFSSSEKVSFQPRLLNSTDGEKRNPQVEILYNFFRQMADTGNASLIRNADYLVASGKQDNSNIVLVGPSKKRFDSTKFKSSY